MDKCQSLTDWIKEYIEKKVKDCRSCGMAVLVGQYQSILQEKGYNNKAKQIANLATSSNQDFLSDLAKEMDKIKEEVDEDTKYELHKLDCEVEQETEKVVGT